MASLNLLGGAVLEDEAGTPVSGVAGRRHPLALLALLATASSRTMPRGKLVGLLWPESPESRARARLNTCVHNVRTALGEDALLSVGDELRLSDESLDCDVWRFERARELLDEIPTPADGRIRTRRRAALAVYEGEWEEARRWYRELYPGQRGASYPIFNGFLEDRLAFAWTLDRLGQQQDAREIASAVAEEARAQVIEPSGEFAPPNQLAVASLILGDTAAALDWLEEGVERGYRAKVTLEMVPTLAPLREYPRFRSLLARVDSLVAVERRRVEEEGWAEPRE